MGGSLLDLGSSNGETIGHFAEARPDLTLFASDIAGEPERYVDGVNFFRADITAQALPWPSASMDGITCMHLVEHLDAFDNLFAESYRLLKPGAALYIETPHPKSIYLSMPDAKMAGQFTFNFWDDLTHIQIMPLGRLAALAIPHGFTVEQLGTSRNWLFAALFPFSFLLSPRKKIISRVHWLGWSSYLVLRKNKL